MIVSSDSAEVWIVSAKSRCSASSSRPDQQAAHADDRVHRGADLVAHRGQERALRLVRRVRIAPRRHQLGDVVVDRVVAAVLAVDDQRDEDDLDVDALAVLAPPPADEMCPARLVGCSRGRRSQAPLARREQELVDVATDRLVRLVAEEPGRGRVPGRHDLAAVHRHDGHRTDLDERLEVLLLTADLRRRKRLVGDVDQESLDELRFPVRIADDPAVVADPHVVAVGVDDPVFVTASSGSSPRSSCRPH